MTDCRETKLDTNITMNDEEKSHSESTKEHDEDNTISPLKNRSGHNITDVLNLGHGEICDKTTSGTDELSESKSNSSISSKTKPRSKKKSKPLKKRAWRPLWKLTKKKRKQVQERERKRVLRDREALRAAGAALAPHNTSEFLIEDSGVSLPDDLENAGRDYSHCEGEFIDKEFEEVYEKSYCNYYENMTNFQLVEQWMSVEDQIEALDKELSDVRERNKALGLDERDIDSEMAKIAVFKEEIKKLEEENKELYDKNAKLKELLEASI